MINFLSETSFVLDSKTSHKKWLRLIIYKENLKEGDISILFCDDRKLNQINKEFLNHDTYTDVIAFPGNIGDVIHGDICISTERVRENAQKFNTDFSNELARVMAHGLLHLCGYKDSTPNEKAQMSLLEEHYLSKRFLP